jgi:RNA recognition motif-containing protein
MPNNLFIGNLPHDVTETQVSDYFSQVAVVHHVKLMTDRKGRSRCFGFIDVDDPDKALLAFNQKEFQGRKLTVSHAVAEQPFRPSFHRGGGRRRGR